MFADVKNKKFVDLSTNETVKVIDQFENIAVLNNKTRIDVRRLTDTTYFDEYIDPQSFFGERDYSIFTDKIKSIPNDILEKIDDNINQSAIIEVDIADEKRALQRKADELYKSENPIQKANSQLEKFKDIIDEEPYVDPKPFIQPVVQVTTVTPSTPSPIQVVSDPIINMFKNTKKNTDFKLTISFEDKIPRLDFIEMMEDSYETSIIDYLSSEFTNQILSDPSFIKRQIKEEINRMISNLGKSDIPQIKKIRTNSKSVKNNDSE